MNVLVCNAGSTSLKFKVYSMNEEMLLAESRVERVGQKDAIFYYKNVLTGTHATLDQQVILTYTAGIRLFLSYLLDGDFGVLASMRELDRIGFKTVLANGFHGIHELTEPVLQAMGDMLCVAPAHNGPYLEAIREFKALLPEIPMVGAFETAFHTTIPLERRIYGTPYEWYETYGFQRMGYHGASHSYIAETITAAHGTSHPIISCHLGGSSSLCAIQDGRSVDTSFGFSLQTGLIHANRTGDCDPYIYPYLMSKGLTMDEISQGLDKNGGLLGISGISNDLRKISAQSDLPRARLALDTFCNGIVKFIGAFYAELGGLGHLAFTGGIGEHSDLVRARVCRSVAHLGIHLDEDKNRTAQSDTMISTPDSPVKIHVIQANEELGVARKTCRLQL